MCLSENPKLTPDVIFSYDKQGNRTLMEETDDGGSTYVRKTGYQYDDARRLIQVDFDTDGDDVVEESVQYTYDAGGLRTQLELPDAKTIVYTYDEWGQLIGLEDWDNQVLTYRYDLAGRMRSAENDNGLERRHDYDAGGRLREMAYATPDAVLGHFAYTLDARGNRIAATETLKSPSAGSTTLLNDDDAVDYYAGTWAASGAYMESTHFSAALRLAFFGDEITLTLGQDSDHGICDLYVNNVLWGSLDTYAPSAGDEAVTMYLDSDGPHVLDIRNRPDNHMSLTGYRLSFKQLVTNAQYDMHTVQYTYDGLSRLIAADYFEGENVDGTAFREYDFAYDVAGNRTQQVVEIAGSPTTTNYAYDAANRLTDIGAQSVSYNNAGQMTDDGTLTYSWDRGGRLLSAGSSSYAYNGLGNRLSQTVSAVVTDYLLDLQPGLSKVLAATTSGNTTRYVHDSRGLHSQQQSNGDWVFPINDGLNSVRSVVDESFDVLHSQHYAPYGEPFGENGTSQTDFGFTGEPTDGNGLVHLRARYLNPELGVFPSLDPVEGGLQQAMSLNRYGYVAGNVANRVDPSGMIGESPSQWDSCYSPRGSTSCQECCVDKYPNTFLGYPSDPNYHACILDCEFNSGLGYGCTCDGDTDPIECTCGPDVTQWFKEELLIHFEWAMQNRPAPSLLSQILFGPTPEIVGLGIFGLYARKIPYKWIDFNSPTCPRPNTPWGNQPWQRPCGGSVTLCGCCIERSELGNFMVGFAGNIWGIGDLILEVGFEGAGLDTDSPHTARDWDRVAWLRGMEFARVLLEEHQLSMSFLDGVGYLSYPDICSFINPSSCEAIQDPRNRDCQPCTSWLVSSFGHTTPSADSSDQWSPQTSATPRTDNTNSSSCRR